MRHRQRSMSFYVEALLLVVVFIVVTLMLTRIFGAARRESAESQDLTNAVCLAQSAAEAVSASGSRDELEFLLDQNGNAEAWESGIAAQYNKELMPDGEGPYLVRVTWEPEEDAVPTLVYSRIEVLRDGRSLYELSTAVYIRGSDPEGGAVS